MRILRIATLVGGLILLVVSMVLVASDARGDRRADLAGQLETAAASESARLNEYFERSATVVRQLSENPTFREFYALPGTRKERVKTPAAVAESNRALGFLERIYSGSIGEACFIDRGGAENARVVRGKVAAPEDLSPDETATAFFHPTMALDFGEVYQSEPYESPDTDEWVVSNSTLVPFADGVRRALVHFEVTIESFRQTDAEHGARLRIIDQGGLVIIDSDLPQAVGAPLGWADQDEFRPLAERGLPAAEGHETTLTTVGGELVAIRPLSTGVVTPNTWYLVVSAPSGTGLFASLSLPTLLVLVGGIAVFGLAIAFMLGHEQRLRDQATTDALTALPNRSLFADRVTHALRLAERDQTEAAVLLLDLNRFKEVNDTLGHHRGDQLLRELATRMAAIIRASDTIARLGGDEFAVLLTKTTGLHGAIEAACRLQQTLSTETEIEGVPFHVEASIGIALYPEHGRSVDLLLQHADVAMYNAKRAGLNYAVYAPTEDPHSADRLALIAELQTAINRGELVNYYQPKYDLSSMAVTGLEALVRWNHPRRGLLAAGEFIPLAEVSGLLRPLTNAVMHSAFAQVVQWAKEGWDLNVAVNISPRSLGDPTFLMDLDDALESSGATPEQIIIEITENSLIVEPHASRRVLAELRGRGFTISIDDFGTGYSSLSYLRELPVDEIKIDSSFILDIVETPSNQAIVASTISLAQKLGYHVVAEGIETSEALELLISMGCSGGQGFLLCRPNEPGKIEPLRLELTRTR